MHKVNTRIPIDQKYVSLMRINGLYESWDKRAFQVF